MVVIRNRACPKKLLEKNLTKQIKAWYTFHSKKIEEPKAVKGRVTVPVASREWAAGASPYAQPVKKTLRLREEIARCESRATPDAPVIGRVGRGPL